ncbi:class I SAM-dependent DNA methyltransferase [Hymenobacter defluvii]|uniref:site-specific DNA-methyltransferase (adenine-specific) n=1 Tax=Hymenobacter defluvii TaxID=2054411 RepID=A0ABS3TIH3_9BACT|nr:class I SAM-dependent DNA methyltransferase [Hymenobacter defluvii]
MSYARALPAEEPQPLFILVADVGYCIDVYSNFASVSEAFVPFPDQTRYRLYLKDLAEESMCQTLRQIFLEPQQLDPSRRAARVTRELAGYLAGLSSQLERAGHAADTVAHFLMRCLFTMFAEDVNLIPKASFTGLLQQYSTPELRDLLPDALQSLWHTMDKGGFSPDLKARLRHFNGKLFHDAIALPLTADQMELLLRAAKADWTEVEPTIFGTLLERALDSKERHRLGAHYTPRRYVERLVMPTIIEPLRREWAAAQAAGALWLEKGKMKEARAELTRFLRRLTSVRILDPACGSGNFLYVTLEHLKRLEGEVLTAINSYGHTGLLDLGSGTTVSPHQLLGLELNPRAAAIADVVLRIGYLQWHLRTHGLTQLTEPLLNNYQNIVQQDAILEYNTDFSTTWPAEWPSADFIIGNPPFIGNKRLRDALGDTYVTNLRKAYNKQVPESADFVMYWWHKAAAAVQAGMAQGFGFITTNSISMTFSSRLVQRYLEDTKQPLSLSFVVPDHPWVEASDGAAVRVSMTVGQAGRQAGILARVAREVSSDDDDAREVELIETVGMINADLTIGADLSNIVQLKANDGISSTGVLIIGAGFIVTPVQAADMGLGTIAGIERHIRPYRNGKDLMSSPRNVLLIDMIGLNEIDMINRFPKAYQHILQTVKPERDLNRDKTRRKNWWLFARPNDQMRSSIAGLRRYIATPETSKHRIFQFLDGQVLPDNKIITIALDDAYQLGVLSSHLHVKWALATGGTLEDRPVYTKSRCFDTFPFPNATTVQQAHIRELAELLDAHRKRQQAQHPVLTLTDLYNVVEKLRTGQPLTAKDQIAHQLGLASVVLSLHQQLDAAVADAYGWPVDLPDAEILTRLVQLNHERAREEQAGLVRYLRPSYQAPEQQATLSLPKQIMPATAATGIASPQLWPTELAQQMQALRDAIQQAGQPLTIEQVAARFKRTKPEKVRPLLDTLAALSLLRLTDSGYAS